MGKALFMLFGLLAVVAVLIAVTQTGIVLPVLHVGVSPTVQNAITFMTTSH
jgi:hypothetical protein